MKRLILGIITICLAEIAYSQTDFRNGYIITNKGDTIVGLVDYREGDKAYKVCDFKKSKDENTISYEAKSLIGYGFEKDKIFQSAEISIDGRLPEFFFFEVIVRGFVSLYKFEGKFFIEKNDSGLLQLMNERREVIFEGSKRVRETKQYIGTLNMLLFDCVEIRKKMQNAKLEEKELSKLIENYNQCMGGPNIAFKAKKPWSKTIIGVTSGLNISQLQGYDYSTVDFEVGISLMIGVSLDILAPRLSERFSFHGDILFLKSSYYGYKLSENNSSTDRHYVTIDLHQLKIPVGIRYTFPKRNFTPYFNLGVSGTLHLSSASTWVLETESNNLVNTYTEDLITSKQQFGVWGGFGVIKSISNKLNACIELRYEQTNGISLTSFYLPEPVGGNSTIANFQLLIGIRTK